MHSWPVPVQLNIAQGFPLAQVGGLVCFRYDGLAKRPRTRYSYHSSLIPDYGDLEDSIFSKRELLPDSVPELQFWRSFGEFCVGNG